MTLVSVCVVWYFIFAYLHLQFMNELINHWQTWDQSAFGPLIAWRVYKLQVKSWWNFRRKWRFNYWPWWKFGYMCLLMKWYWVRLIDTCVISNPSSHQCISLFGLQYIHFNPWNFAKYLNMVVDNTHQVKFCWILLCW